MNLNQLQTTFGDQFTARLKNCMFQDIRNVVWDLQSGATGVETPSGIKTMMIAPDKEGENTAIEDRVSIATNIVELFTMKLPAFATFVNRENIEAGDMICVDGNVSGWVLSTSSVGPMQILTVNGEITKTLPTSVNNGFNGSGQSGFLVVKTMDRLFSDGDGDKSKFNDAQSLLMPMMMFGGDNVDFKKLLPFLLMNKGGNSQNMMVGMMMANMFQKK